MTETAFDDADLFDDEHDRQWGFGVSGAYLVSHRGRLGVLGAIGLTADTARCLAARLIEAADTIDTDRDA
jgi:hypothetical protein